MADTIPPRGSFGLQVAEWAKRTNKDIDIAARKITFALFSGIIQATPVGEDPDISPGRARGNWQTSVGAPVDGVVERLDQSGAAAVAEVEANMGGAGKVTYLTNNLEYIEVLEYGGYPDPVKKGTRLKDGSYEIRSEGGYSKQSPQGMVRTNLARVQQIVDESLKG
jgi:hypothetical protein